MLKLIWAIIIVSFILVVAILIMYGVAIFEVIKNPELIGQFFGKIVEGFNSVK
jgi:hypothetical protein